MFTVITVHYVAFDPLFDLIDAFNVLQQFR